MCGSRVDKAGKLVRSKDEWENELKAVLQDARSVAENASHSC